MTADIRVLLSEENDRLTDTVAKQSDEIDRLRAENASLSTWQCEFTDGKTGLVYGQGGTTFCIMAKRMEQNLGQVEKLSEELERVKREAERAQDAHGVRFLNYLEETARLTDEIKRLEAEVKVWVNHTKTAVWSDSEECKVLSSEVERLLKSRNRWAKKYNDLLAKRRAEDGYDVYAAAREEYRKKITEQAAEIDRLWAALREIATTSSDGLPEYTGQAMYAIARAALGEKP